MATHKFFSIIKLKNHFSCLVNGDLRGFLYREMIRIGNFLWSLASSFLLFLFGFLDRYLHRLEADENYGKYDSSCVTGSSEEKDEILKYDWPRKKEKFQMFSEFKFKTKEKSANSSSVDNFLPLRNTRKYEISFKKDFSGFVEEPKTMSFTVEEMFLEPNDGNIDKNINEVIRDSQAYLETNFQENYLEKEKVSIVRNNKISKIGDFWESNLKTGEKTKDSVQGDSEELVFGISEKVTINENIDSGSGDFQYSPTNSETEVSDYTGKENTEKTVQVVCNENNLFGYKETERSEYSGEFSFSFMNSGLEVCDPIKEVSFTSQKVHPISYNEEDYFQIDEEPDNGKESVSDYSKNFDEEFIELVPKLQFSNNIGEENGNTIEEDEDDEFDILLEHQENIEKMKVEMKNSKLKGLPTILENCESFKIGEDLKPLKIDEKKFEYKDRVDEIQKVYRSYSEKMKKLDILNYQTLNAINFMQLKDPNQRNIVRKTTSSAINSIFPSKLRRIHADPTLKTIFEMHKNLEIVYVGQLCLTWETLRWEYEKAKELLEYDSNGVRSYNLVAGEFQQFQVLLQRFVENEQFLGARVQNYAKNRCELRVFLQVPIIKEDCLKEKKENSIEGKYEIPILMLSDIIGETIRTFWEFLSADHKDDKFSKLKGLSPSHVDLQVPSDSELLIQIKANLSMKEKKLKDILRTGNCIVKKFQKQQEGKPLLNLLFAQTDLKLVSRVLNMSKLTTDQLLWCQNKLHKVEFSNRKVHLETSFLLFPF